MAFNKENRTETSAMSSSGFSKILKPISPNKGAGSANQGKLSFLQHDNIDDHFNHIHGANATMQQQLHNLEAQTKQTGVDLGQLCDRSKNNNQYLNKLLTSIASYSQEVVTEGNATKQDISGILGRLDEIREKLSSTAVKGESERNKGVALEEKQLELAHRNQQLKSTVELKQTMEAGNRELKQRIEVANRDLKGEVKNLNVQVQGSSKLLDGVLAKLSLLDNGLPTADSTKAVIDPLRKEFEQLQSHISSLKEVDTDMITSKLSEIQELQVSRSSEVQEQKELELKKISKEIEINQGKLELKSLQLEDKSSRLERIQSSLDERSSKLEQVQRRLDEKTQQLEIKQSTFEEKQDISEERLQAKERRLDEKLAELEKRYEDKEVKMEDRYRQLQDQQDRLDKQASQLELNREKFEQSRAQFDQVQTEAENSRHHLEEKQLEFEVKSLEFDERLHSFEQKQLEVNDLEKKSTELEKKLDVLTASYQTKYNSYQELQQEYQKLVGNVTTVEASKTAKLSKVRQLHTAKMNEIKSRADKKSLKRIVSTPLQKFSVIESINEHHSDSTNNSDED